VEAGSCPRRGALLRRHQPFAAPPRQCGHDFRVRQHGRDDDVSSLHQSKYLIAARFVDVELHHAAAVEVAVRAAGMM
jgi:hypothetical protein